MRSPHKCPDCGNPVLRPILRYCDPCHDRRYLASLTPEEAAVARFLDARFSDLAEQAEVKRARDHADPYEGDPIRKARFHEAVEFIGTYKGNFGLIHDLRAHRAWGTKWFRLSDRQVEVVLNCKARMAKPIQIVVPNPEGPDLRKLPIGRTYAAVENEAGALTFLIFDQPKADHPKWGGWVFVKQQQGPNEVKVGAQRPGQPYAGNWPSLMRKVLDDPMAAVIRYGRELGVCGVCGLPLTNEQSREAGIGPVCRARIESI